MHGLLAIERSSAGAGSPARPAQPFRIEGPAPSPALPRSARYGEERRPNWVAIATVVIGHILLLAALVKLDVIAIGRKPAPPLTVDLITLAPPPPPQPPSDPKPEVVPMKQVQPPIVAPPPIVLTPAPPPAVAVAAAPPPPQAVVVAEAPKSAAAGPPMAVDLSTRMVSAKPPRYPTESRRKREQGTVVLRLLLGLDGAVDEIAVARSSGFDRLDKAALDAVRHWRWSPTVQAGEPVQVRGMVEIPFVLQG